MAEILSLAGRPALSPFRLAKLLQGLSQAHSAHRVAAIGASYRHFVEIARPLTLLFDREHLRQVLWNLLRNGVRHARELPGSVRIVLNAYADQVELNVIDNGPGVAREILGQLFEPFFTTESKGTGLGLYLARELCAANRAALEYVDDMQGAHFRVLCRASAA